MFFNLQPTHNLWNSCLKTDVESLSKLPLPFAYPSSVCINDIPYVGSGDSLHSQAVFKYIPETKQWHSLPAVCNVSAFALGQVNNELIAVGGWDISAGTPSPKVLTYNPAEDRWEEKLPEMPTPRFWASVASNSNYLVVSGGLRDPEDRAKYLQDVEVYEIKTQSWKSSMYKLPFDGGYLMSSVLTSNNHLLIANSYSSQNEDTEVYSVSLKHLFTECHSQMVFSRPVSSSTTSITSPHCQSLQDLPPSGPGAEIPPHSYSETPPLSNPTCAKCPWVEVKMPEFNKPLAPSLALFDDQIIAISSLSPGIHTFSVSTCSWGFAVCLANQEVKCHKGCAVVELKPDSKLMLIGGSLDQLESRDVTQLSFTTAAP